MVPQDYVTPEGIHLGSWICRMKEQRKKDSLSPEQIAALDDLGIVWDPDQVRWEETFVIAKSTETCGCPAATLPRMEYSLGTGFRICPEKLPERGRNPIGNLAEECPESMTERGTGSQTYPMLNDINMVWEPRQAS